MRYVVFGTPLHVEATSEAEAARIGEQHGLLSPIVIPLPEPIQMDQGPQEYLVFDRAKDEANYTCLIVRAASKEDAEREGKEKGQESPHAELRPKRLVLKERS